VQDFSQTDEAISVHDLARLLQQHPNGLSSRRIGAILNKPAHLVMNRLVALQTEGKTKLKNGSMWQWIGPLPQAPVSSYAVPEATAVPAMTVTARLPDARNGIPHNTRWAAFRRLCLYYAECVRLEDRARVSEYAERENRRFLTLGQGINWHAISSGAPVALTVPDRWGDFVRHISGRRASPRLFVGAPLDVMIFPSNEGEPVRIVSPVFVIQVEHRIEDGRLYLQPVSSVEVNHGWLEKRFKTQDDRRVFMELVGLETPEPEDAQGLRAAAMPDMHQIVGAMFRAFKKDWREFADLDKLTSAPPLQEIDQRGIYNRAVVISQPTLKYAARLHEELLWLAQAAPDEDLDRTALRHLFPHESAETPTADRPMDSDGPRKRLADVAEYEGLNAQQRVACQHASTSSLSVVTGPPGTGKSRVVAQAMANAAIAGNTVLFSSRNHQAIEAVVPRLNELVSPDMLVIRLAKPFGDASPDTLTRSLVDILASPRPADVLDRINAATDDLNKLLERRLAAERKRQQVFELYQEIDDAESAHERALDVLPAMLRASISAEVKVPSEEEVERTRLALEALLTPPASRLARFLWRIRRWFIARRLLGASRRLDSQFCELLRQPAATVPRISDSKGMALLLKTLAVWADVSRCVATGIRLRKLREALQLLPALEECHAQYALFQRMVSEATLRVLKLISLSYGADLPGAAKQRFAEVRGELQAAGDNLHRVSRKVQKALMACFPMLLKALPLWATSNLSVGRNVPRAAGAFDLLIIDEASQCDIASVIPLLLRADSVMVVGDPMQLPHVATMRKDLDQRLRARFDLTDVSFGRYAYTVNSFFDLAFSDQNLQAAVQLQEHHRSHPAIAGYSNDTFYKKTLKIMTSVGHLRCPTQAGQQNSGFRWTPVPADAELAAGGGAISRGQAQAVLHELQRLREDRFPGSVGVVTPFRAQATRIMDMVTEGFGPDVPAHWRFHADTADGFQGDERDVILLSLPGGPGMPRGSLWFLSEGRNRFNVAVSRARALLHVFADQGWCRDCGIPHIQALHQAWESHAAASEQPFRADLIGPVWEPKLAEALRKAGISFEQQRPECGRYLDFAIVGDGVKLDVEVDGESFHRSSDGLRKIDDLFRDLMLIANGWKVLRFWVYQLREDMDACVQKVRAAMTPSKPRKAQ
jgi:very-short-patch-repair endonuclease